MTTPPTSWEDRLMDAVVGQFFAPNWQMVGNFNPSTGETDMQMIQVPSAAARVASDVFAANREAILESVKERVDLDEIANLVWERIRDDVIKRLTSNGWLSGYDHDQGAMRSRVNELVAQELARRTIEKMDQDAEAEATP